MTKNHYDPADGSKSEEKPQLEHHSGVKSWARSVSTACNDSVGLCSPAPVPSGASVAVIEGRGQPDLLNGGRAESVRRARVQPNIPERLCEGLKRVAASRQLYRSDMITEKLSEVFRMESGSRIPKRGRSQYQSFSNATELVRRARSLAREKNKIKFVYVFKSIDASYAVKRWAAEKGITLSGLFAALIERLCIEHAIDICDETAAVGTASNETLTDLISGRQNEP